MFSGVCQGLQLCLEPRIVESHFFRLSLAPSPINLNPTEPETTSYNEEKRAGITDIGDNECKPIGGWSFLQSLACSKSSIDHDEVYVHPLVKNTAFTLSEKSLDMCTESLGSETGSEISGRSCSIPFLFPGTDGCDTSRPRENSVVSGSTVCCYPMSTRRMSRISSFPPPLTSISGSTVSYIPSNTRRMSRSSTFPPPLTSISGSNGVQVTSHREGGRLVVQAVSAPTCHTYMHAERSEGRLRLCLFKDSTLNTPISDDQDGEEEDTTIPTILNSDDEDEERERGEVSEEEEENGVVEYEVEEESVIGETRV
ncbi:Mitochondrial Rho GTPase [Hibiscus syriacus]|uniref:Mitochondrial Rho GTPase n=1 Tax=Hibiscus syriacus TaxID=106335 RepID=A0A6A3AAL1_HIBSY|nr:Mitochondrial Rho GTPase [Hibiscus syriacus]